MARRIRLLMAVTMAAALLVGVGSLLLANYWHRSQQGGRQVLYFGIADRELITETAAARAWQLTAMKAIGITSVRMDADWDAVQHGGPRVFDWGQLDQAVSSAREAGMAVDLIIDGCPRWAALAGTGGDPSSQPASSAEYATWAAEVAGRYGPQGVRMFEIWNEPNSAGSWPPAASPAAYAADLIAAYSAIKSVDRSAFVISGGLAPGPSGDGTYDPVDFLKAMYAYGAKGSFDAVGFHPYSFPALPDAYEAWSGWSQMAQTNPSLRSVMASNGDSGKPIWITEYGAPSSGPGGVGNKAQATALGQAVAYVRRTRWIGALYVYTWRDRGSDPNNAEDWFGLLTAEGSRKPAYSELTSGMR